MNFPSALQLAGVAVLLSGALGIGGCGDSTVTYVPEVVGIVSRYGVDGSTLTYTLADGRTVTEQVGAFTSLRNPSEGDLLLAGSSPGPWIFGAYPRAELNHGSTCYLVASAGTRKGDWIQTDLGLRLPVSKDFSSPLTPGPRFNVRTGFCLDEQGEVVAVY